MGRSTCRLLLFLAALLSVSAGAQTFRAAYPGTGAVKVGGDWRFHTSDDMAWAAPGFDDSQWENLSGDDTWGAQTHSGHTGYAWYRRAFEIDGVTGPLSIAMPPVNDAYELYWNGRLIGGRGTLPPHASWNPASQPDVIDLPQPDANGTLKGVLAIRVWKSALSSLDPNTMGGLNAPPLIGDSKVLKDRLTLLGALYQQRASIQILLLAFLFIVGCVALGMWVRDRQKKPYLWLALFLMSAASFAILGFTAYQRSINLEWSQVYIQVVTSTQDLATWMLILTLFGLEKERLWRRVTTYAIALYLLSQVVDMVALFYWSHAGPGIQLLDGVTTIIYSAIPLYIFVLLAVGLRRNRDKALVPMALACSLQELFTLVNGGLAQGQRFTHIDINAVIHKMAIHLGPNYTISVRSQISVILLVVMVWTVVRQQVKERQQQKVVEDEVKSAREVQQVLVPEAVPPVPGFAISSLYWPAEEVGGDLFQIIPGANGDVIVALADVSGKGLKAAMTVSLIVGALRTFVEYTTSPVEILDGLNRRLLGRTDGGFATCVIFHISANGHVLMANAGHLSPFLNGEELPVGGTLPLGLVPGASFEEVRLTLSENDELTVYTDGVLEAMNEQGEMFGFDRCREMMAARPSVETLAEQARHFGQKDDITAVRIVRVPAGDTRGGVSVALSPKEALA